MTSSSKLDWWSAYPLPESGEPHVRMNFVSSADGAVTIDGRSGGLGGHHDRELMKVLRTLCDVVLVGAGTVRAEGYGGLNLPEEYADRRESLGLSRVPRMAIVSGSLDLTPDMSVFTKAESRPIVFARTDAPAGQRELLEQVADVVMCSEGPLDGEDAIDLGEVIHHLGDLGLGRILSEGGPTLFGSLLEVDLVDEVCLTVSPHFVSGQAPRIAHSSVESPRDFRVASLLSDDESFVFLRYERATSGEAAQ
ncbi:pyrimidine reductase family protein [Leucobacter denitrificans]|uniref:Pyrimidine reductase family protein n=1 Tax=Leucobacter denitrificans TaxID=683042 RepID=A0A7G9S2V0_9MICO|nr:pyrimidine reductase family protein [Leucobacter denitrificans]QNN62175.1 pyrimidine reductase family protein [Leucobacter denitrificans]